MKILFTDSQYHSQRQYEKPVWIFPAHLAMYATYLRNEGHEVTWLGQDDGTFDQIINSDIQIPIEFDYLPIPDRIFTNAMNPKYLSYGNYKYFPGSHYLSSNLCWWAGAHGCVFCIDSKRIIEGERRGVRSVDHVLTEIDDCIQLGFKELFDDAGTIPVGKWLKELCNKMIDSGRNQEVVLGCNLKPLKLDYYPLMKKAGFRFILIGIESANQKTVDVIQKGQRSDEIIPIFKCMSDAGLEPHATFMFGYAHETHEDAMRTVDLAHYLLKKGYAKTAQASVFSPPRTAPDPHSPGHRYVPMIYDAYKSPQFWWQKVKEVRRWEDIAYWMRGARLVIEEKLRKKESHAFSR